MPNSAVSRGPVFLTVSTLFQVRPQLSTNCRLENIKTKPNNRHDYLISDQPDLRAYSSQLSAAAGTMRFSVTVTTLFVALSAYFALMLVWERKLQSCHSIFYHENSIYFDWFENRLKHHSNIYESKIGHWLRMCVRKFTQMFDQLCSWKGFRKAIFIS